MNSSGRASTKSRTKFWFRHSSCRRASTREFCGGLPARFSASGCHGPCHGGLPRNRRGIGTVAPTSTLLQTSEAHRDFDTQALARAVVHDVEQSELAPTAKRVVHEVQRPALVATTWQAAARRAAQSVAAIASTSADAALIAIQGIHAIGTDSLAPRQEERAQPSVAKVRPQRFGLLGDELTQ